MTKEVKVTDKYLLNELFSGCENGSISKRELNNKIQELNTELSYLDLNNILKERLLALLEKAEIVGDNKIDDYQKALEVSVNGYRVIHKRDIDEIFVNNFSPEWIHS